MLNQLFAPLVLPAPRGAPDAIGSDSDPRTPASTSDARTERERWRAVRPAWTDPDWWDVPLRSEVRRLIWLTPGPELATALDAAPSHGPCVLPHTDDGWHSLPTPGHTPGFPCACQVVTAAAWEAMAAWVAAGSASALVAAAGSDLVSFTVPGISHQLHDPAREELAPALRCTSNAMGNRIMHARALAAHPLLHGLVREGAISAWAGRLVTEQVSSLDEARAEVVVATVVAKVRARLDSGRRAYHSAEINQVARAARLRICPESAEQARVRSFAGRKVSVQPLPDGMALLTAELADVDAHRIHRRLSSLASGLQVDATAAGDPDPRTRNQLRADLLVDLLLGASALPMGAACGPETDREVQPGHACAAMASSNAEPSGSDAAHSTIDHDSAPTRPEIQVIVTMETLLGLRDDPAQVPGIGLITADVARTLAADGRWTAWLVDASGAVTATGSRGYVPSAAVARLVRAREPHCRFPGCRQSAHRCDLDHAIPWPRGSTTPKNLGPLCRRHHNLKTHGDWQLEPEPPDPDGGITWRWLTPAGLTYSDGPPPPLPD